MILVPGGGEGRFVIIERAVEHGFGGDLGIDVGRSQ